jgi:hypothetical protein
MFNVFGKIFGSDKVINSATDLIDKAFYTEQEKAEDNQKLQEQKTKNKIDLLDAYAPFKVTQRVIAISFSAVFLFIMINGVFGSLYGVVPMENVKNALSFANDMGLTEAIWIIVTFYFGGGLVESIKKRVQNG